MKATLHTTWFWITRGLAVSSVAACLVPAATAQSQSVLGRTGRTLLTSTVALTNNNGANNGEDEAGESNLTAVKRSRIAPIKLPDGAFLFTGKKDTASLIESLEKFAEKGKVSIGTPEVLVWQIGDPVHKQFAELCGESGYRVNEQPTLESEDGKIALFTCAPTEKGGKKSGLFGFWGSNGRTLVLAWAAVKADDRAPKAEAQKRETQTNSKPASTEKAAAKAIARPTPDTRGGSIPSDLLGDWSWTTIGSVNYLNTNTNTLLEPSGMSARFTFTRYGRYKKFFYIRQRTYSLVTESTTTEEGTVTYGDGTFPCTRRREPTKSRTGR